MITPTQGRISTHVYDSCSSALCRPDLIQLRPGLVVATFRLMKLIPAKYIIEKALADGSLDPTLPVIETSSGTFALGLGIVCAEKGIAFHIVSDSAIDERLQARLNQLGGKVQIVGRNISGGNVQVLRLEALQAQMRMQPASFWPRQYDNHDNQMAYRGFARQLVESLGTNIELVGTVGSGASTCGTVKALREIDPSIRLAGVDTFGSVLFGLPLGSRRLRGLGNSIHPNNLDHTCFDQVHWVSPAEAFASTRRLHAQYGLFCGPTSGAAFMVAEWLQKQNKTVVFIAPDEGHRYADSVYCDDWMRQSGYTDTTLATAPVRVNVPSANADTPWTYLDWDRGGYEEVTGQPLPRGDTLEQVFGEKAALPA